MEAMTNDEFVTLASETRRRAEDLGADDAAAEIDVMLAAVQRGGPSSDEIANCRLMDIRQALKAHASSREHYMLVGALSKIYGRYAEWPAQWHAGDLCCATNERGGRHLAMVHEVGTSHLDLWFGDGTLRRVPRERIVQAPGKGEQVASLANRGVEFGFISERREDGFVVDWRGGSTWWQWSSLDLHRVRLSCDRVNPVT